MRRLRLQGLRALCFACVALADHAAAWELQNHLHADGRIKQLWFPATPQLASEASPEERVQAFLEHRAQDFRLSEDLSELRLIERRESLLGIHFRYQQILQDKPVENAQIIVSVLRDGRISQVSSTLRPSPSVRQSTQPSYSLDQAYDKAWNWLGVRGHLLDRPRGELVYLQKDRGLRLAYRLQLHTSAPYGVWQVHVDAENGQVLAIEDRRIMHRTPKPLNVHRAAKHEAVDRQAAFAAFTTARSVQSRAPMSTASGVAQVFDPDPRTTLSRRDLDDDSPAEDFAGAYVQKPLADIDFDGSYYHLQGPWARIADFDPPLTPPSLSTDGRWVFERGNNGFNDAMSYFHVDQNQRYIQSIGYKDQTGLQFAPIEIDSDGANGEDNSYYNPMSNRLSFGHGVVDDNEDADVILHEYFHAIQFAINPSDRTGDRGAMGEGFSDYWAGSYSLEKNPAYFPNEMFSWDGHSDQNKSWPGRTLNASTARYNPSRTYPPGVMADGGFKADELWSTPLFQSLLILRSQGIPRQEVDRIIIEAQFGFGPDTRMPEMAQAIIASARLLYPGPHAEVFKRQFIKHGILVEPQAVLNLRLDGVNDSGGNGGVDPGEAVEFKLSISNSGNAAAEDVSIEIASNDSQLEVVNATRQLPNIPEGDGLSRETGPSFKVRSTAACGSSIQGSLILRAAGIEPQTLPFTFTLGTSQDFKFSSDAIQSIPDNNPNGVVSTLNVSASGTVSSQFRVGVSIKHPYRHDLRLSLVSPSGKKVLLHNLTGFSNDDIEGVYPLTLQPHEPLSLLLDEPRSGTWKLQVSDLAISDVGSLRAWSIADSSSFICQF